MISRDELLVQAKTFDLSEANVQRDYVFGWIISGIFRESSLADRATLKGGNALRKGYLPGTRFSDDLDFSTLDRLDGDGVLAEPLDVIGHHRHSSAGDLLEQVAVGHRAQALVPGVIARVEVGGDRIALG